MSSPSRRSDTIVIQTFRNQNIPAWIQRCLHSVQKWAALRDYEYSLAGDEFYNLCGPEYLSRGSKNPQAITNLARLVATRERLDAGYQRVIWLDADVFVFDPARLVFDFPAESLTTGYAFGREVILLRRAGVTHAISPAPHNAATFFTQNAVDLDMLIALIRHIDSKRHIVSNYQVGVRLLRGLQYSLMFPTFSHVAVFSPVLLRALAEHDEKVLRFYGQTYLYHSCAGNLCLARQEKVTEAVLMRAIDRLEAGQGDALNQYAPEPGVRLLPYDSSTEIPAAPLPLQFAEWRPRLKAKLQSLIAYR